MKDRFRAALFGTALGDAWAYPYQLPPQEPSTPLPRELVISDDTQMTLALSTALRRIDRNDLDRNEGMEEIAHQFLAYRRDADYERSPSASCTESLDRLEEKGAACWGSVSTHSGGSGGIMRVSAAALLARGGQGVGWSVLQAILTHDSGIARATAAILACVMLARPGSDLLDVASGLRGDKHFDQDTILDDQEKSGIIEDLECSIVSGLHGGDIPLAELFQRVIQLRETLSPLLAAGDFEELYRDQDKFLAILGKGYDAGSCAASALLLAQLYLDHREQYEPHDFLHVAVNWLGNRNTRASLTGGLIGAHLRNHALWEDPREYRFEPRYDEAIHSGVWTGFSSS